MKKYAFGLLSLLQHKPVFLLLPLLLLACGKQGGDEAQSAPVENTSDQATHDAQRETDIREGRRQLASARQACLAGQYDAARDTIFAMRRNHPLAIDARRQGILVLDSIELMAARDSLSELVGTRVVKGPGKDYKEEYERLDIKVKFFERKIIEDQKRK